MVVAKDQVFENMAVNKNVNRLGVKRKKDIKTKV
jgi:hypothetical protein